MSVAAPVVSGPGHARRRPILEVSQLANDDPANWPAPHAAAGTGRHERARPPGAATDTPRGASPKEATRAAGTEAVGTHARSAGGRRP